MKIEIGKKTLVLMTMLLFVAGAGAWTYTTPPDSILNATGFFFGNSTITSTEVITDFLHGNGSNITGLNATNLTKGILDDARLSAKANNFNESYSYLIYLDGSTIYAKNGNTGAIDYSGTNHVTVLQSAINATGEGEIRIRKGLYNLTSGIRIYNSGLKLIGEGEDITASGGVIFNYSGTSDALEIHASSGRVQKVTVSGITINATGNAYNNAGASGIVAYQPERNVYKDISIKNFYNGVGFIITSEAGQFGGMSEIDTLYISNTKSGLAIYGYEDLTQAINAMIVRNFVFQGSAAVNGTGLRVGGSSFGNVFEGFVIDGLSGEGSTGIMVQANTSGNVFISGWTESIPYHYNFYNTANVKNNTVIGHNFYGSGVFVTNYGQDNLIINSVGYIQSPKVFSNRATAPVANGLGDTYFNTSRNKICYYNGTGWNSTSDLISNC